MGLKIDKTAVFSARYPRGTILRLTAPVDDPFTPKQEGDQFVVDYIDDALQIHGSWKSGGSMALVIGKDSFEIATDE